MALNPYFSHGTGFATEQNLYEDLTIESLKIYGHDFKYVPRDMVEIDRLYGEDIASTFTTSYDLEMYVENSEGYQGTELFQKFGIEIRDEATLVVSRRRWAAQVGTPESQSRPFEGDLVYVPFSKTLFEITNVEHEEPFYQLMNLPVWKLRVSVFEYNDEKLDIDGVDTTRIQKETAQVLTLASAGAFILGETISQAHGGILVTGELLSMDGAKIVVGHVTSSTGEFQMFQSGVNVTGDESNVARNVTLAADWNSNSLYETNDDLDVAGSAAIFDPSNPYGEDY